MKNSLKMNFIRTVPVLAGYIVLGIGFGIVLKSKGYGIGWAFLMSACIYAGSMQFVAIDLIGAGAGLLTAALTTLMVNARHLFYGISMVDRYRDSGKMKPYLIFGLTDETYSLVSTTEGLTKKDYLLITLFDHSYWILGSVLGGLIGTVIPWDFAGVDFALTALFVCILTEQCFEKKNRIPAVIGLVSTLLCLLLFGTEHFLIPSMGLITLMLTALQRIRKEACKNE